MTASDLVVFTIFSASMLVTQHFLLKYIVKNYSKLDERSEKTQQLRKGVHKLSVFLSILGGLLFALIHH